MLLLLALAFGIANCTFRISFLLLFQVRSNNMKRERLEKAQTLLSRMQRRLEALEEQMIAADDGEMSHSTMEVVGIKRNNELEAKLKRLKAHLAALEKEQARGVVWSDVM